MCIIRALVTEMHLKQMHEWNTQQYTKWDIKRLKQDEKASAHVLCSRKEAVRSGAGYLPESVQLVRQPPQGDQETGQHW